MLICSVLIVIMIKTFVDFEQNKFWSLTETNVNFENEPL